MLFRHIDVLRADGTLLPAVFVGVRDKRIVYIGKEEPAGNWGETVDGAAYLMIPGLVNSHTHVAMTLMRGYGDDMPLDRWLNDRIFPFEDKLTGEDVYWGSLLGIAEMLRSGTTSFSDMYYFCDRVAQAVRESGIKANIGRGISCFDPDKRFADLPAYRELTELLDGVHGEDDGRIQIDVAPHSEYTTRPDILADAAQLAADHRARMQVHVSETRKEHLECVGRHGMTPAQVLEKTGVLDQPVTAAHCVWLSEADMALFVAHGVTAAHCPKSNLKLASGIAQVEKMQRTGMCVALGTDSAASNNALSMFREMYLLSCLQKGVMKDAAAVSAEQAFAAATESGYRALGLPGGTIERGNPADMVLLDLSAPNFRPENNLKKHIVYSADNANVLMTVANGKIVYDRGNYDIGEDIDAIYRNAERCIGRLKSKAGL